MASDGSIYLPPGTTTASYIRVGVKCYEIVGLSVRPSTSPMPAITGEFDNCQQCSGSSSSSSSSSSYSSSSSSSSTVCHNCGNCCFAEDSEVHVIWDFSGLTWASGDPPVPITGDLTVGSFLPGDTVFWLASGLLIPTTTSPFLDWALVGIQAQRRCDYGNWIIYFECNGYLHGHLGDPDYFIAEQDYLLEVSTGDCCGFSSTTLTRDDGLDTETGFSDVTGGSASASVAVINNNCCKNSEGACNSETGECSGDCDPLP